MENFLLPNMIELFKTNLMSHFPPFSFFYHDFSYRNSAVICGPELCRRNGIMKTRLATNIDSYPLTLALCSNRLTPMVLTYLILSW